MSLPDPTRRRVALALAALAGLAATGGCTVQPLYGTATLGAGSPAGSAARPSIAVKPVSTRVGLEVRNHLIFLLTGGGGEPADTVYSLDMIVTSSSVDTATIQRRVDTEPTSAQVTVTAGYRILDNSTGKAVATGRRSMVASYDVPQQEFASLRALRDAENRAARELAEILRLAIGQDIVKLQRAS
jgi:LPS-assembly lipoprotein